MSRHEVSAGSSARATSRLPHLALLAWFAALTMTPVALAQVSKPIAHDYAVTKAAGGADVSNKFLERKASPDSFDDEEALHPQDECPANLELRWMTEVTSSIYSTPVITDLFSDGHKEVVVPSFVHYLEVLEGEDGAKAGGDWPAFHKSTVHASPLVHDTGDGTEILLPMYDGEVLFYNDHGALRCDAAAPRPTARLSSHPRAPCGTHTADVHQKRAPPSLQQGTPSQPNPKTF